MRPLLLAVLVAIVACGGSTESMTGVVLEVQGDLTNVERFTLIGADGARLEFEPEPGVTFDGGPLGHLRDHLRSGEAVVVRYRVEGDVLKAIEVADAQPSP